MDEQPASKNLYEELTELVDSIEKGYTQSEMIELDLSDTFETGMEEVEVKPEYSAMLAMLAGLEGGSQPKPHGSIIHPEKPRQMQQVAMQSSAPTVVQIPPQGAAEEVQKPPEKSREKHLIDAKKELGMVLDRLGLVEAEIKMKGIKTSSLILPNLSVPDQISELERIIEGLTEKVFDAEHLDVIKQEVNGLNSVLQLERAKKRAAGHAEVTDEEKVRDQRLSNALALLKGHGAS